MTAPRRESREERVGVVARCIACKATRIIGPDEINPGDILMCRKCWNAMFAESATNRIARKRRGKG